MALFERHIQAFEALQDGGMQDVAALSLLANEKLVLDLNREHQLFDLGENYDGSPVRPAYKPYTVFLKKQKGQPYDRVTLRDTGDFYKSFKLQRRGDELWIVATDWKTVKLIAKYGHKILGVNEDGMDFLKRSVVAPALLKALKKAVYGNAYDTD